MALHAAEEVTREEVVGRLRERQRDDDDVGGAEQVVEAVRLPERHPGLGRDAVDVDREHLHAEAEGTPGDGAAGAAQADDAHGLLPQLALLAADRLAQAEVGLAQRGVHAAREREQQGEGVLGQMDADLALLGGQDHVALDQFGRQDRVHARAQAVVVTELPRLREDLGAHAAEQHVGVDDLLALAVGRLRHHEHGVVSGGGKDLGVLLGGERGHQRGDGRIDDLHAELSLVRARRHRRPPRGLWTGAAYAATLKKISRAARRRWSMLARPVATSTYSMLSATSAEGTPRRERS